MGSEEGRFERDERRDETGAIGEAGQERLTPVVTYNTVFEDLFDRAPAGKATVAGAMAYALYKSAKREWTAEFREREGRPPREDEMKAYNAMWTPSLLEGKRLEAQNIIDQFSQSLVEAARPAILKEALRGTASRAIWLNVASNAIYTLLVLGIVLIIAFTGLDIPALLQKFARIIAS